MGKTWLVGFGMSLKGLFFLHCQGATLTSVSQACSKGEQDNDLMDSCRVCLFFLWGEGFVVSFFCG